MIKLLPSEVVNQIAAGEVVERPASILKELIENSVDAGATEIKVFIEEFGTKKIQVIDNGSGIDKNDLENVFTKHATSKINSIEDIEKLYSYGFRGEALASISSVSKVILQTKHKRDEIGSEVVFENGKIVSIKPSAIIKGTDIQILSLFENVPARKKFLKSKSTENKILLETWEKFVLANSEIAFSLNQEGSVKNFINEPLKSRVAKVFKVQEKDLIPVQYDGSIKVSGFVLHPKIFLKNKDSQWTFVNKRPVTNATIYKAVVDGFDTFLMKGQYPGFVVFVDIAPSLVDVNVHPRKTEVQFVNSASVYNAVRTGINVNLVSNLRKETHQKLSVQELALPLNAKSLGYGQQLEKVQTAEKEIKRETIQNPHAEFEAFLHSDHTLDKKAQKISLTKQNCVSEKALLFNHEIIKKEKLGEGTLNLDFQNATQLLNSYILTSNDSSILVIDQHAASERYFYEQYLNDLKNKKVQSKLLLFPEVFPVNEYEMGILTEYTKLFEDLGFIFEEFGLHEVRFTQVPDFIKLENFPLVIQRIVHDVFENGEVSNIRDKIFHETAAILACHTAVRFGDSLTKEEMKKILQNLSMCKDPYNCPHGRPVIQEWTRYDVEKKFKRCGL